MSDRNILVVDDEFHIRDSIKIALEDNGYLVFTAGDGREALKIINQQSINVVISDINMPIMGGIELLKKIRTDFPYIEVIMLTGYPTIDDAVQAIKIGAFNYVTKPFKINRLFTDLERCLEKQELTKKVGELGKIISIYESSKALNSTLKLDEVLHLIISLAVKNAKAIGGMLCLFNENTKKLQIESVDSIAIEIASKIQKENQQIVQECLYRDELMNIEVKSIKGIKHVVCVPLKIRGRALGCLIFFYHHWEGSFAFLEYQLFSIFASQAAVAIENAKIYENLEQSYLETIKSLSTAVDAKDPYTRGHSENVMKYVLRLVNDLEFSKEEVETIRYAALLHDIGKIGIRLDILSKNDRLTKEEYEEIKKHPLLGKKIIEPVRRLQKLIPIIYHHHERFDGGGYPEGLRGEDIPFGARLMAAADTFDAITSDRAYRKGKDVKAAIGEIKRCSGTQFDPQVVKIFCNISEEEWVYIKEETE